MTSAPSEARQSSLVDLYESIAASENPELALLRLSLETASQRHSKLPEALRLAAIPRRYDLELLGLLRGEDLPGNETQQLFQELAAMPLVHSRTAGVWSVTDTVRDLLLSEWRSDSSARAEFKHYNQVLVEFYEARYDRIREYEEMLGLVSRLLRRVSKERYDRLAAEIQTREVGPLLEALYHAVLGSAQDGFDFFERCFQKQETLGRAAVCESLLHAIRDYFDRLPAEEDASHWAQWLRYYEARLANRVRNHEEAWRILEEMRTSTSNDEKLLLWVLSELGTSYEDEYRYVEAREVFTEELALAVETQRDPFNIPVSYFRLAELHRLTKGLEAAARFHREAARSAVVVDRSDLEIMSRIQLSRALHERGAGAAALKEGLRAIDLARRLRATDAGIQDQVCNLFMELQAREDPVLLDTLRRERRALHVARPAEEREAGLRHDFSSDLYDGGQIRRALSALKYDPARLKSLSRSADALTALQLRLGITLEELGRMDEAAAVYTELIEGAVSRRSERFNVAAALSNRGLLRRDTGAWDDALSDLESAFKFWQRMGWGKLSALMQVYIGSTEITAARGLALAARLDQAKAHSSVIPPELSAEWRYLHGEWDLASQEYREALAACESAGQQADAAHFHGRLAVIAGVKAEWRPAAEHANAAAAAWRLADPGTLDTDRIDRLLDRNRLEAVQQRIDAARRHLNYDVPIYLGELWRLQAEVHRALGDHEQAYACYGFAAQQPEAIRDNNDAAGICIDLSFEAGRLGRGAEAAGHAEEAARIWQKQAAADGHVPGPLAKQADEVNSRGMWYFTSELKGRAERLNTAHDQFEAAARRVPDNWWYTLNLSYACAELTQWVEAAEALDQTLRNGPVRLRDSALALRLASYRVEQGRQLIESGQTEEAADALAKALAALTECDSDGADLLPDVTDIWMKLSDMEAALGQYDKASAHYRTALRRAEALGAAPRLRAELHARRAFSAARRGRTATARGRLRLASEILTGAGQPSPYRALVDSLEPLVRTAEDYDSLAEVLRDLSEEVGLGRIDRREVVEARLEMNRRRLAPTHQPHFHATPPTGLATMLPVVTPITLAGHPSLFPEGEEWAPSHALFTSFIPRMRASIVQDLGVRVPGIRVQRATDLPQAAYQIRLDEVPVATSEVVVGSMFSPVAPNLLALPNPPARGQPAWNPRTGGQDGVWLEPGHGSPGAAAGVELWSHFEYMVQHLEVVLRRNIGLFFGLEELHNLLEDWKSDEQAEQREEREQLLKGALPDLTAKLGYLAVLHGLLSEGVSIQRQDVILDAFKARDRRDPITQTVESVRLRLRDSLPGNAPGNSFLLCGSDFEERLRLAVVTRGHARFLAGEPEVTQVLLAKIRQSVLGRISGNVTLVCRTEGLRPFLRRLTENSFPDVKVLSQAELLPELESRVDGTIALEDQSP